MDDTTPVFSKRVTYKLTRIFKGFYQNIFCSSSAPKTILFILGCQRSGTSIMTRIFERDFQAQVFGEYSEFSSLDKEGLRLNPLDSVREHINSLQAPLVVIKPLVESQRTREILDFFPNSKVIWMYRHYKDVAASNLKKFNPQNCINNLRPIVDGDSSNWRSQNLQENTRETVSHFYDENMNPADAAALFWYVRNTYYFDMGLDNEKRVKKINYDDLVKNPYEYMNEIYSFLGRKFPGERIVSEVHSKSKGKGQHIDIRGDVEGLCDGMLNRLQD